MVLALPANEIDTGPTVWLNAALYACLSFLTWPGLAHASLSLKVCACEEVAMTACAGLSSLCFEVLLEFDCLFLVPEPRSHPACQSFKHMAVHPLALPS